MLVFWANIVCLLSDVGITQDQVDLFCYFAQYNASSYCSNQMSNLGGMVQCGNYNTCPLIEMSDVNVTTTWIRCVSHHVCPCVVEAS